MNCLSYLTTTELSVLFPLLTEDFFTKVFANVHMELSPSYEETIPLYVS